MAYIPPVADQPRIAFGNGVCVCASAASSGFLSLATPECHVGFNRCNDRVFGRKQYCGA